MAIIFNQTMPKRRHSKKTIEKIRKAKLKNPTRYWLGKKRSPETIAKIKKGLKGKVAWNKGIPNPSILGDNNPAKRPEIRKILSEQKIGEKNPCYGKPAWNKGLKRWWSSPAEFKKGQTTGSKNANWKGGITPTVTRIRNSSEMRKWCKFILKRDNYICQVCKKTGGKLHADHMIPFGFILSQLPRKNLYKEAMNYPPLWNRKNGRTICLDCHKKTPTYLNGARYISSKTRAQWKKKLEVNFV